jgi:hypothetical protein
VFENIFFLENSPVQPLAMRVKGYSNNKATDLTLQQQVGWVIQKQREKSLFALRQQPRCCYWPWQLWRQ